MNKDFRITQSPVLHIMLIMLGALLIRTFGYGLYRVPTGSMETTMLVGEFFFADKMSCLFAAPKHGEIIAFNDPTYDYSHNSIVNAFQRLIWGPSSWTKRVIGMPGDHIQGKIENGKPVVYRNDIKLDEPYLNEYPLIGVWQKSIKNIKQDFENNNNYLEGTLFSFKSFDPEKDYENQPWYAIDTGRVMEFQDGQPYVLHQHDPKSRISDDGNFILTRHDMLEPLATEWNGSDEFSIALGPNQYWVMGDNRCNSHDSRSFGPLDGNLIHGRIIFRIASIDSSSLLDCVVHPSTFWKSIRWERCAQRVA